MYLVQQQQRPWPSGPVTRIQLAQQARAVSVHVFRRIFGRESKIELLPPYS